MHVAWVVLGLSFLVLWHELGHAAVARVLRLQWTDLSFGFGPTVVSRTWRGVRWRLGLIPFGGFVRVSQLSLRSDEPGRFRARAVVSRVLVLLAGSGANFVLAAMLVTLSVLAWGQPTGKIVGLQVTKVSEQAASGELLVGDRIERVNDIDLRSVGDLQRALRGGGVAKVELLRGGTAVQLMIPPVQRGNIFGLGARYVAVPEVLEPSLAQALAAGGSYPFLQSAELLRNTSAMLLPDSGVRPVTPVGLADRVSRTGAWDGRRIFDFAAMLSVVVGLFNLLPIPGLDGARLALEAVETMRRKRVSIRWALYVQVLGAVALFVLWVGILWLDLSVGR
jgi:regulator of sigma E protease